MNKNLTIGIVVIAVVIAVILVLNSHPSSAPQVTNNNQTASPCANSATKEVIMTASSKLGNYLTDSKCMTLYVTANDKNGQSSCYDACAQNWPPFMYDNKDLKTLTGDLYKRLNVIKRKDGTYQYSYGTTPLYHYKEDTKVGDMKGDGINKVWSIILLEKQGTR